jgi:hypothetical protein
LRFAPCCGSCGYTRVKNYYAQHPRKLYSCIGTCHKLGLLY